jgi:phosphinothricin acetyltransferase
VNSPEVRAARVDDLPRLTEIYSHYVMESPATLDLEPSTVDQRREWFAPFRETGRHRLLAAEESGAILGYAGTMRWRPKPAYDTTVETTIYCAAETIGRGVGARLYAALFEAIAREDVHRGAAMCPSNPASAALHERFGFRPAGTSTEVGYKFGTYWDECWLEKADSTQ